jgi:hypothetical protein
LAPSTLKTTSEDQEARTPETGEKTFSLFGTLNTENNFRGPGGKAELTTLLPVK